MIELTGIPTLETERLILRPPRPEDTEACVAFYASERSSRVGGPANAHDAWVSMARMR
mgnify:CR=1 FL=1